MLRKRANRNPEEQKRGSNGLPSPYGPFQKILYTLGKHRRATLKYTSSFSLTPAIGGEVGQHVFSINGLYDPDITGVGTQPFGFDQLMVFYDHYVVLNSRISCVFTNSDTNDGVIAMAWPEDQSTATILRNVVMNYLPSTSRNQVILSPQGGPNTKSLVPPVVNVGRFLSRNPFGDPQLKGGASSNPTEQAYWHVGVTGVSDTAQSDVTCIVTIEYDTVFIEPKPPPTS